MSKAEFFGAGWNEHRDGCSERDSFKGITKTDLDCHFRSSKVLLYGRSLIACVER